MPLESLLALVEKLRERIDDHGPLLDKSEMQTRYALVDPLLRELGWDTENPAFVRPEFKVRGGRPDYVLLIGPKPAVMGEVKSLKKNLKKAYKEGLKYCQEKATRYLFVTNGRHWEIYDTYKKDVSTLTVQFDLENDMAAEVCKKVKMISRSLLQRHPQPISMSEWAPPPKSCPIKVQFPDNSDVQVETWKSLLVEVTRWLVEGNHLKIRHCPILCKLKGRTHYAVSTEPFHSSGKPFGSSVKVRSFYVEAGGGNKYISTASRTVIEHVGQNPAKFKVWFY